MCVTTIPMLVILQGETHLNHCPVTHDKNLVITSKEPRPATNLRCDDGGATNAFSCGATSSSEVARSRRRAVHHVGVRAASCHSSALFDLKGITMQCG